MPPRRFITYVVTTVLVFWIILGAVTLPNASKWLRGTGHAINKDIVFFNRSEYPAINNGIPIKYGVKVISMNVLPVDNAPNVPREGVKGILYDLGESCGDDEPKVVPKSPFLNGRKNLTRIALVKQSENCFLADKIINAELDGALGVIIYQQKNSLTDYRGLGVMPKTVNIPAFYVEPDVGTMLLRDVATYYKKRNTTDLDHSELMVRVHLLPSTKPKLDYWQFALIIIGGMVLISVIAVVATQYHLWRIAKQRQRQRFENVENNNETTVLTRDEQRQLAADEGFWTGIMGQASPPAPRRTRFNYILDQALVDLLPTRIFHSKPEDDSNDDLTDEKTEVELNEPIVDYEPSHCVICLDEFADGDILRRLPCCHEYHRDCIDIWLTKKSSSCPLCLAPVSIPTVPEEGHTRDDSVDSQDLAQTWINLSRAQATSLRTHPFAYNQTPREY